MANRLNNPNQFETLSPPWLLTQLDTNFVQNQAAWNDSSLGFVNGVPTDTGTANNYTITAANLPFGSPTGYNKGMTLLWIPANTNTASSNITVLPLGSTGIVTASNLTLTGGEIAQNRVCGMVHDGTNFRIITPCGVSKNFGIVAVNQTLDCAGYSGVQVSVGFNANNLVLFLNHVSSGVPISATIQNNTAGTILAGVQITDPTGTSFSAVNVVSGGGIGTLVNLQVAGMSIPASQTRVLTGVSGFGIIYFT